ncbi:uncharacterized protein stbd1 [Oryzias melastigma]|uniref:Starch-binding domain-containing protein 1 n=1 Tax=Oryzias melastigma TaxID=30732 RepID=A0A3B3CL77_ORYME|nr:uncharacterized protein stbd1 [Oryzias melastigma]
MQLKNGHAAAMDKRVDLGSLFCMIGRHGPAVAVAVIAVVSVLAGFIIYRNVKGKRRKAADGDAPPRPEEESNPRESRGHVRSTDEGTEDLSIHEEADPPQSSMRNRRAVVEKRASPPRPTEKISGHAEAPITTLAQDSGSMTEPRPQDSDEALKYDGMMAEKEEPNCDYDSKKHPSQSKPAIGEHHQDQNEVLEPQEDEIMENVSTVKTSKEKVQWLSSGFSHDVEISQETDKKKHKTKASRGRGLEEPTIDADQINSVKGAEVECNAEELRNESLGKFEQLAPSEFSIGKVIEDEAHLNDDAAAEVLDISPQQTKTGLECGLEEDIEEILALSDEQNHSSVAPGPPLSSQPPDLQDSCVVDPINSVSQLEREVGGERWCKDTESVPLMGAKETQGDEIEGKDDPSEDRWVPSSCNVPEEAVPVTSSEMGRSVDSFEEQTPNADLPNAGPVLSPNINADDVCPIGFDKSELTWSPGAGEESGISSMTVSPDLLEADYDPPTEGVTLSVTDLYPDFGAQTDTQNKFLDNDKAPGGIRLDASNSLGACLSPQHIKDQTTLSTNCEEQNGMDQFTNELKPGAVVATESENGEKTGDDGKTEISIMEATMDTNEWMTDGNEAHPWVSPPVPTVDHRYSSSEVETPPDKVNTDESVEKGKKVAAVQPMSQDVHVSFHIHYVTQSPFQKVAITGNQQELGNWKGFVPLEKTKDGHWATVVSLPAESHVEWKFVVVDKGEVCRWEECGNRLLETGSGDDLLVHKWWGIL